MIELRHRLNSRTPPGVGHVHETGAADSSWADVGRSIVAIDALPLVISKGNVERISIRRVNAGRGIVDSRERQELGLGPGQQIRPSGHILKWLSAMGSQWVMPVWFVMDTVSAHSLPAGLL